jgi:hypothetical protein
MNSFKPGQILFDHDPISTGDQEKTDLQSPNFQLEEY